MQGSDKIEIVCGVDPVDAMARKYEEDYGLPVYSDYAQVLKDPEIDAVILTIPHLLHEEAVIEALKTVYDPEIPVNIYELGLIYGVEVDAEGRAEIRMTLTAPACPVAGALVEEVAEKAGRVEGVSTSHVELVWDPPWTPDNMTEAAKLELGML